MQSPKNDFSLPAARNSLLANISSTPSKKKSRNQHDMNHRWRTNETHYVEFPEVVNE